MRFSCAVRRCCSSGGERPPPLGRRSGPSGAGGSLSREVPARVGAPPTKPGCVSTARWRGSGERDGEEYARNRWCKAPQRYTDSNLADAGREQCAPAAGDGGGELPEAEKQATGRPWGRSAAYPRRGCWGRVGLLLRRVSSSEHGNRPGPRPPLSVQDGRSGWVHRRLIGPGRGGAVVVLGAGESPAQGEGRQRFRGARRLQCRKTRRRTAALHLNGPWARSG